jgi:1,4-alpha-glucan branching enzyme
MPLAKRKLGRGKVRVTFSMPAIAGVTDLALVGDFNNWSITQQPLKQAADGTWSTAVTLDEGQTYQYRYYANGQDWHNDWQADGYKANEHGSDNCVVSTKAEALPVSKAAAKKASKQSTA